jgi:hypothetical protein
VRDEMALANVTSPESRRQLSNFLSEIFSHPLSDFPSAMTLADDTRQNGSEDILGDSLRIVIRRIAPWNTTL